MSDTASGKHLRQVMNLSPQSAAVIRDLMAGKQLSSSGAKIGPFDKDAKKLLQVMMDNYAAFSANQGEARARALRSTYIGMADVATTDAPAPDTLVDAAQPASPLQREWRLDALSCESIRGVAPPGIQFTFTFGNLPTLIYGPNGSGKSSLLAAVVWVFTGRVVTDSADASLATALFETSSGATVGKKLCDWPIVTTLPAVLPKKDTKAVSSATVVLQDSKTGDRVYLRRQSQDVLEVSPDNIVWQKLDDLDSLGITSLDVQLSLVAPTVFGRRAIEEADDTRSILSLMLGFDDLEKLGDLASQISGNRTRLANQEAEQLNELVTGIIQELVHIEEKLVQGSPLRTAMEQLRRSSPLTTDRIDAAREKVLAAVKSAEQELAATLGLQLEEDSTRGHLADQLTVALATLAKGVNDNCPSFVALHPSRLLGDSIEGTFQDAAVNVRRSFNELCGRVETAISDRYEWWLRETEPGSKAALLLVAAKSFDEAETTCPVCDRRIDDPVLVARLLSLKSLDGALGKELRIFFADLIDQLKTAIPAAVRTAAVALPNHRLETDWKAIHTTTLGASFKTITDRFHDRIALIVSSAAIPKTVTSQVLPAECDPHFTEAAKPFLTELANVACSIDILEWSIAQYDAITPRLTQLLFEEQGTDGSLLSEISRGKVAASTITPLSAVAADLAKIRVQQQKADKMRSDIAVLAQLSAPLDAMKTLAKYAESKVATVFDTIREQTLANLRHLYPGSGSGMKPSRLQIGKGKDKGVEAYLSGDKYEVLARHFANAGLQRAIALAFYFALLDQHPMGLSFVLMDDPILSLDEDHRERWSDRILRPALARVQVVLATHQKQFLRHCGHDFAAGVVVELNPRDRSRPISWRPGNRLDRAQQQLASDWTDSARTMRLYREEVLVSIDAYCPEAFFDASQLSASFNRYAGLKEPHPLAHKHQEKIVACLSQPKVAKVLDPASHHLTEADVTKPMVEDCLTEMRACDGHVRRELERLEKVRVRSLRDGTIAATIVAFPNLDNQVTWKDVLDIPVIGLAAAKSEGWSVDFQADVQGIQFPAGAAVAVSSDALEPVARFGQWLLLADESTVPHDGDLVAVRDEKGNCYLRRAWSGSREWVLQSINPVSAVPVIVTAKRSAGIRKIIGVIYEPLARLKAPLVGTHEWTPSAAFDPTSLSMYRAIEITGSSLDPVAKDGQFVLVEEKALNVTDVEDGSLAVIEQVDGGGGNLIKRFFRQKNTCVLVSPNPVDPIAPVVLPLKAIQALWPLRGILFESV